LVIGATGGTGRQLVQQALEQGHQVTAFVPKPKKLKRWFYPNTILSEGTRKILRAMKTS